MRQKSGPTTINIHEVKKEPEQGYPKGKSGSEGRLQGTQTGWTKETSKRGKLNNSPLQKKKQRRLRQLGKEEKPTWK